MKKKRKSKGMSIMVVIGAAPKPDGRPSDAMMQRVRTAIALHKKNRYDSIIISGGPTVTPIPESDVMKIILSKHVPKNIIRTERNACDTIQNAVFSWELIKDDKIDRITVVTSNFHMRRTKYIFRKLYSHIKANLIFESAQDHFDPIAGLYYYSKEIVLLVYDMFLLRRDLKR
jgi:vancomycin permeability regulator SanA